MGEPMGPRGPSNSATCADAIHTLQNATAVGIDLWSPADLRKLPNKALQAAGEDPAASGNKCHMAFIAVVQHYSANG
eukprot:2069629-Karenia_brevis.AAC.1